MDDDARGQLNYVHKTAGTLFPLIFGFTWLLLIGTNVAKKSLRWALWAVPLLFVVVRLWGNVAIDSMLAAETARRRPGGPGVRPHRCGLGAVRPEPPGGRRLQCSWDGTRRQEAPHASVRPLRNSRFERPTAAPEGHGKRARSFRAGTRWAMTSPAAASPIVIGYPISRSRVPGSGTSMPGHARR